MVKKLFGHFCTSVSDKSWLIPSKVVCTQNMAIWNIMVIARKPKRAKKGEKGVIVVS